MTRFRVINGYMHLPDAATEQEFKELMKTFMVVFLLNERVPTQSNLLQRYVRKFEQRAHGWNATMTVINETYTKEVQLNEDGLVNVDKSVGMFRNIGFNYHTFNDRECHGLKTALVSVEDAMPGRVRLVDFYNKSFYSSWRLTEKPEYLRTLGALDETDGIQRVVIPNYMQAMPNCLKSSDLYSVCCPNDCEELMKNVERNIAAPIGDAEQILKLVAELSSDTVPAPRKVPESLRQRLLEIAATHKGKVPLHGRLFAQWMHHAYPRECPYPHVSGNTSPQSPEEWVQINGVSSSWDTEASLRSYIRNATCNAHGDCGAGIVKVAAGTELPWTDEEELPLVISVSKLNANPAPSLMYPKIAIFLILLCSCWYATWTAIRHLMRVASPRASACQPLSPTSV